MPNCCICWSACGSEGLLGLRCSSVSPATAWQPPETCKEVPGTSWLCSWISLLLQNEAERSRCKNPPRYSQQYLGIREIKTYEKAVMWAMTTQCLHCLYTLMVAPWESKKTNTSSTLELSSTEPLKHWGPPTLLGDLSPRTSPGACAEWCRLADTQTPAPGTRIHPSPGTGNKLRHWGTPAAKATQGGVKK